GKVADAEVADRGDQDGVRGRIRRNLEYCVAVGIPNALVRCHRSVDFARGERALRRREGLVPPGWGVHSPVPEHPVEKEQYGLLGEFTRHRVVPTEHGARVRVEKGLLKGLVRGLTVERVAVERVAGVDEDEAVRRQGPVCLYELVIDGVEGG